mmetsp:Transcript_19027/g.48835  ORF Transcript_19027/g.48835 Transcript_19027/m.48835 type:complete len:448 (+) Transcript_19027:588-1931(+)
MYNGIGLLTARGSGTSGYVSTNKFNLRGPPRTGGGPVALDAEGPKQKKANQDIIEHNRKREIEAKVFELQDQLEEDGLGDAEIESEVTKLRTRLEAEARQASQETNMSMETHQVAVRKERQMDKLASAFGIRESKEGDAFNQELQAKLKEDRRMEREQKEKDREKAEKDRAKAQKKAEKERKRAAKEAEEERLERLEKERKEEMQRRADEAEAARRAALPPSPFSDRYSPEPDEDLAHVRAGNASPAPTTDPASNGISGRLHRHVQSVVVTPDGAVAGGGLIVKRAGSSPPAQERSPSSSVPSSRSRSASPSPPKARLRHDSPDDRRALAARNLMPPPPDRRPLEHGQHRDGGRGRSPPRPQRRRSPSPPRRRSASPRRSIPPNKRSRRDSPASSPRRRASPVRGRGRRSRSPSSSRSRSRSHSRSSGSSSSSSGSSRSSGSRSRSR